MSKWHICIVCSGEGTVVNPNIDDRGLSAEHMDDPDFQDNYCAGVYDIACRACGGSGKIKKTRQQQLNELHEAAEERRLAARENGDFDAYAGAGDWRHGY